MQELKFSLFILNKQTKLALFHSFLKGIITWQLSIFLYSSVYFYHLSLISSASVRSIPFLSFIVPIFSWNVPLVSLIFLKRCLVFPILLLSSVSLHWSLRKAFLSLLAIVWNSAFKWVYLSFPPLPLASLLCTVICKASSDNHFAFVHLIDYAKAFDSVDHNKLWKIFKEMGIPDHLTCLLRNLYAGQEAAVRTGHGTTDWYRERSTSRLYVVTLLI